ncbi:MAG TPA: peptidylprolyl isomerase [Candidatus Limnocylindrales bacterium]|nr:peptidylprolyl isomerase [Candidatus Limnocylindrales bacterium]
MTFRGTPAARPAPRRSRASAEGGRRTLLLNLGFGLVILVSVVILAAAAGASWYGDHFGEVAKVDGTAITRDQYRDRYAVQQFRFDRLEGRIRDDLAAGRITQDESDQRVADLEQQRNDISTVVADDLIDAAVQSKLAADEGLSVSDQEISDQLRKEATRPEERHLWLISVEPQIDSGKSEPTDAQVAAAKAKADHAVADLKAGKAWEEVAKSTSSDPSASKGGDLGWHEQDDSTLDPAFAAAVFAAQPNAPTDVVVGADGVYRIGRATEVLPPEEDPNYQQSFENRGVSLAAYQAAVRADVVKQKLEGHLLAQLVDNPSPMRQVQEIHIAIGQGTGDEVHVRHILYAAGDLNDPSATPKPSDDPAWAEAKAKAQATYDTLKAYVGKPDELETQFEKIANTDTADPSGQGSGGDLPYLTRDVLDSSFADAVFKNGLKKGDLIGPVQSSFGWHVILFEDRRPPAEARAQNAAKDASDAGADFSALVRQYSDGPRSQSDGSLGWVARWQLGSQQLEDAIFATTVPGVSTLVDVPDDGWYLFKVSAEETRKPDPDQAAKLRASAFDNWYAAQKAKADIKNDLAATPTQ